MLAALVAIFAAHAVAQLRTIPKDALRGQFTHITETIITIDGRTMRLAPGAQIRSQKNLIVVPSAVPPGTLVEYTLDRDAQLDRVWILTSEEAARPNPNSSSRWIDGQPAGTPIQRVLPKYPAPDNPQHK
ncbi:MAG: hypothetical protein IT515_11470 [Burkholderiales bacterium]|nr:hypothetical protein [Burkholderiales bacterium]